MPSKPASRSDSHSPNPTSTSFDVTRKSPIDTEALFKRYTINSSQNKISRLHSPHSKWLRTEPLIRETVKQRHQDRMLLITCYLFLEEQLQYYECERLSDALYKLQHGRKYHSPQKYHTGAKFWIHKVQRARAYQQVLLEIEMGPPVQKALTEKEAEEEARFERGLRADKVRIQWEFEKEKARKEAERAGRIKEWEDKEAMRKSQQSKKKTSRALAARNKNLRKHLESKEVGVEAQDKSSPSIPPKLTSRGRQVKLPYRYVP